MNFSICSEIFFSKWWLKDLSIFKYFSHDWFDLAWFGFMTHQPLQVIQYQIHFYKYKQFYFKQFSLVLE